LGLRNIGGFDVALLADRLGLGTQPDRLRLVKDLATGSTQSPSSPPTRMKVSA
jgi:hypothetical protein